MAGYMPKGATSKIKPGDPKKGIRGVFDKLRKARQSGENNTFMSETAVSDRIKKKAAAGTAAAAATPAPSTKGTTKPAGSTPKHTGPVKSPAKSAAPPSPPSKPSVKADSTSATTATSKAPHTAANYGGKSAVNGSNGTVKAGRKSSWTRSDATGSTTGERARLTKYSAMDRNK